MNSDYPKDVCRTCPGWSQRCSRRGGQLIKTSTSVSRRPRVRSSAITYPAADPQHLHILAESCVTLPVPLPRVPWCTTCPVMPHAASSSAGSRSVRAPPTDLPGVRARGLAHSPLAVGGGWSRAMSVSSRPLNGLSRLDAEDRSPYQRLSQRMLDISGDRGVLKDVIREGAGELVTPDASVLVKYSGYLEHMDKPFDSNCFRKTPRLMKLGEDITLWGMELGLLSMRRGELARFLFKPTYAYGTLGCPPLIPPNTTVLFEIELLDFLDSAESDKFCALSAEQQSQFPLQKVLKVAATEREFGNYLFRQNRFYDAKVRYKRALLLLHRRTAAPEEQHLVETAKLLVFLNLSFTYLKLERPTMALRYGEQALIIDQKNAKALFRCGQACLLMTEYQKARDFLVRAQREQPFNHDINNELKKLASYYRDYMDKEREMCHRMFAPGDNGSTVGEN